MTEETPTSNASLATALAKAQGGMSNASLNKDNPYFHSRYADLASIRDATIPHLSANGLAIYHATVPIVNGGGALQWTMRATLVHGPSGQFITSDFPLPNTFDKPQVMGSAITYARRYTWAALCGIAAEEDDDANLATGNEAQRAPKKPADDVIAQPKPPKAKALTPTPIASIESPYPEPESDLTPRLITTGADNPDKIDWVAWGVDFIDHIKRAPTPDTADKWVIANATPLAGMRTHAAKVHTRLANALFEIYKEIGTEPPALP